MSDNQNNENKWKDRLLKSSLPLEQLVSEKLAYNGFTIHGEYSYIRPNENDIETEFSVDNHAFTFFKRNLIDYDEVQFSCLVECKYSYPGTKWVFSPQSHESSIPVSIYGFHKIFKQRSHTLNKTKLPACTRGIELNNSGSEPYTISRGLHQLHYGIPSLILQEVQYFDEPFLPEIDEFFICPILVTTAHLYVLMSGQNLNSYHSAESLDDVANSVDALLIKQERGPHMQRYYEKLLRPFPKEIDLDSSYAILPKKRVDDFFPRYNYAIVVHLDHLADILETIIDGVKHTSAYEE